MEFLGISTMNWLGCAILSNLVVASLLALVATIAGWRLRYPAVAHGLWVLVLLKLITPPIVHISVPISVPMPSFLVASDSPSNDSKAIQKQIAPIQSIDTQDVNASDTALSKITDRQFGNAAANRTSSLRKLFSTEADSRFFYWSRYLFPSLIFLWAVTSLTLMTRSLIRSIRFGRVLESEGIESNEAKELCRDMANMMGLSKSPRVRFVSASLSPMLFGFGHWASIVVPKGLWDELNKPKRLSLLAHELSHYRRGDHWVRSLELVVGSLYFWFPLVRIARMQLERMEETCCDLNAVDVMDKDRRLYAESLLHVVDYISQRGGRIPGLASAMRPTITLEERLRSIMNESVSGDLSGIHRRFLLAFGAASLLIHPLVSFSDGSLVSSIQPMEPEPLLANIEPTTRSEMIREEGIHSVRPSQKRPKLPLPPVPKGWWSLEEQAVQAKSIYKSIDDSFQLKCIPGSTIDVEFAGGVIRHLDEPAPTAVASFGDGKRLIVGNRKGDIRIWDVLSQESVSWIGRHEYPISTLCYHPKFGLLSGDANGYLLQWEVRSGAIQNSWSSNIGPIQSIRSKVGGDEVVIIAGDWKREDSRSEVVFFDPAQWSVTSSTTSPTVISTAFYEDGAWYTVDWNGNVTLIPLQLLVGTIPKSDVTTITFSQNAKIPNLEPVKFVIPLQSIPDMTDILFQLESR